MIERGNGGGFLVSWFAREFLLRLMCGRDGKEMEVGFVQYMEVTATLVMVEENSGFICVSGQLRTKCITLFITRDGRW